MSRKYSAKDFKFLVLKKKKKPYIIVGGYEMKIVIISVIKITLLTGWIKIIHS